MPPADMEKHNNLLMINAMKEHGTLLWYKTQFDVNDFVTDQPIWKVISQKTRLKSKYNQWTGRLENVYDVAEKTISANIDCIF